MTKMMAHHKLFFLIEIFCVLFLKIYHGDAARGHKLSIQFERAECTIYNKELIESFNCSLQRNDVSNELLFNAVLILAKDVNDVMLRVKILYDVNGNSVSLVDANVDICSALTQRFDFYLLRMIKDELYRRSNAPYKCPIKGNILYYVRNFTINSRYFPPFFPESKWSAYYNFSSGNSLAMIINAFGTTKRNKL